MNRASTDFDSILHLCQKQHRRIVLAILAEERRELTLSDLTEAVLRYNHHVPLEAAAEDTSDEIRLSLYHSHLPKLASAGLIDYDQDGRVVELTEQFREVQPTVSMIIDADPTLDEPIEL
ncbi:hypothetical protein BRC89_06530 [Halobacteriales archaeon QS_4_70_19]|nr:MAG: hypothetical protein BRC89_06530 [Halobacteriales archaeon QS_4_70_19]